MAPLIITNDLQLPSIETFEAGGGGGALPFEYEDNIGIDTFIALESNIDIGRLVTEDNI